MSCTSRINRRPRYADPLAAALIAAALAACDRDPVATDPAPSLRRSATRSYPGVVTLTPRPLLATVNGVDVFNGGFGSAIVADPSAAGFFYLMTDRGPNFDFGENKAFPVPRFAPQIGRFRLQGSELRLVSLLEMKRANGIRLSGLPNPVGAGGTGELPFDVDGTPLPLDEEGLDSEGLVAMADGTFWVADEYGPHLVHLDASGRTIERVNPFGAGRRIPAVLAARRANRGMEGLTVLPDGVTLVGIMQSPLDNPRSAGRDSRVTRILSFDTRTGATRQYVYLLEDDGLLNSEIAALTPTTLLVLERDGDYPGDPEEPSSVKRIYKIDLAGATDVSDPANAAEGRLVGGKTLESLTTEELAAAGIVPVAKTLVADLLELGYPHDKPEGLAVVDDFTIAVSNDDDFGVTDGPDGLTPKVLPKLGVVDFNTVYFVRVATRLRPANAAPVVDQLLAYTRAQIAGTGLDGDLLRFRLRDTDRGPWTLRLDWGDGVVNTPTVTRSGTLSFLRTKSYAAPGRYTITVTATDAAGTASSPRAVTLTVP